MDSGGKSPPRILFRTDLVLRLALVSTAAASVAVTLSGNQRKTISSPLFSFPAAYEAKFTYSSAILYSLVATAAALLHGVSSAAAVFLRRDAPPSAPLLLLFAFADAVMGAVMGSATGALSSMGYVAFKGNSHVGWSRVCNTFDVFCWHVGASIALSLVATWILLGLVLCSTCEVNRRGNSAPNLGVL